MAGNLSTHGIFFFYKCALEQNFAFLYNLPLLPSKIKISIEIHTILVEFDRTLENCEAIAL